MAWQEKIVVITGGASDLGQAVARFFAEQGATVILADRAREALEAARAAVGGRTFPALADMGDEAHVRQLYAPLERVDVLVSCGGLLPTAPAPIEETPADPLVAAVEAGVYGPYWAAKHALPKMDDGSAIIFIARGPAPYASAQSMVGGAVTALMRAVAAEVEERGVRVNGVILGQGSEADLRDDAVRAVAFLVEATHITGAAIAIGRAPQS